jgi:hypothetical protein
LRDSIKLVPLLLILQPRCFAYASACAAKLTELVSVDFGLGSSIMFALATGGLGFATTGAGFDVVDLSGALAEAVAATLATGAGAGFAAATGFAATVLVFDDSGAGFVADDAVVAASLGAGFTTGGVTTAGADFVATTGFADGCCGAGGTTFATLGGVADLTTAAGGGFGLETGCGATCITGAGGDTGRTGGRATGVISGSTVSSDSADASSAVATEEATGWAG